MKSVLIIEPQMKQYRAPFYAGLYEALRVDGIELKVAYSDPPQSEAKKSGNCDLPVEYGLRVKGYWLLKERLLYQWLSSPLWKSDLVIVDQANKNVLNHLLLAFSLFGLQRVAFWGHGRCLYGGSFSEWYKRKTVNFVDWWFSYTKGTTEYLHANGVPADKITTIFNAVDTKGLREELDAVSENELGELRQKLGLSQNSQVGIFTGTLYEKKGIPFLIEAGKRIRAQLPEFHLVLIGEGNPNNGGGMDLSENSEWLHYAGPCFGREKARLLKLAEVFLLPGAVGLAIVDAFAASLPLVTTSSIYHGPEIEYLEHGKNGLMTAPSIHEYAATVENLLQDRARMAAMRRAARESGKEYSIERMVENFCEGIERCLAVA